MGKNKNKKRLETQEGGLVYSTNKEVMNQWAEKMIQLNKMQNETEKPTNKTILKIRLEKKGRGGKTVTIIEGYISAEKQKTLMVDLKKTLATGGTIIENTIEIQGDKLKQIRELLKEKGFIVKG